jgi:cysteine-rich repeat protein
MKRVLLAAFIFFSACPGLGSDCGNGVTNIGEACDDGNARGGDGCNETCTKVERCGDGITDTGEACDDGNLVSGDGCSDDCDRLELCGDGVADADEECDDGNLNNNDGCSNTCTLPGCGDTNIGANEQCDGINLGGQSCTSIGQDFIGGTLACDADCTFDTTNCTSLHCGDNILDQDEECDDGNFINNDGCSSGCKTERCGDGTPQINEQCDDGNAINSDGCDVNCTTSGCGNQIVNTNEDCDDGNIVLGDGCRSDCSAEVCGDGIVDPQEQCDDGNQNNNDACPNNCGSDPGDNDGDGFTESQGDCNDSNVDVSPANFEVLGDGLDNDCNGQLDVVLPCDSGLTASSALNFAKALGLCGDEVEAAQFVGPSVAQARAIVSSFGANNTPFEGASLVHLSTGAANTLDHNTGTDFFNTFASPVANLPRGCGAPGAVTVNDYTELELKIRVPENAHSFSFAFQFFSSEYPTFRCTQFSDTFAALITSNAFTGNITLDAQGNGVSLNSDFFQVCVDDPGPPPQDCTVAPAQTLQGTGYELDANQGGATLPLLTTAPATPGDLLRLRLLIFDEGDGVLDSSVLLDSFTWHTQTIAQPNIAPF